jgi:hypothetical protein
MLEKIQILEYAEKGTIAMPCRQCEKVYMLPFSDFREDNNYTCGYKFACGHKLVVVLNPMLCTRDLIWVKEHK